MPQIGSIFYPAPVSQEYLVRLVRAQYQIWREEKEAREPKFIPENIRFEHDPDWRNRIMSVQCAHDCNHPFWLFFRVAWFTAAAAPYLVKIIG